MDSEMDMVCIDESEENIICCKMQKLDFPAVCVHIGMIYFNSKCGNLLSTTKIHVSKTKDFVIFREAHPDSANAFRVYSNQDSSAFYISGNRIMAATGLNPGQYFRLYSVKGGGFAIKRYEPIQVHDRSKKG